MHEYCLYSPTAQKGLFLVVAESLPFANHTSSSLETLKQIMTWSLYDAQFKQGHLQSKEATAKDTKTQTVANHVFFFLTLCYKVTTGSVTQAFEDLPFSVAMP